MTEILTSAQMRAIERAGIESGRLSGLDLMERAGAGVAEAILAQWPDAGRAVVLCGPGNNGGDGYVVARLLAGAGWAVTVHALAEPATADARAMRAAWAGPVAAWDALDGPAMAGAVVVDALFGTGLARALAPGIWGALALAHEAGARLVAVDILSGIDADSGRVLAEGAFPDRGADLTVTFQAPKRGHMLLPGGGMTGALRVVDLGLGPELAALDEAALAVAVAPGEGVAGWLGKGHYGHKFSHGHVLVLAGGPGQGGAARLAARAALRAGAGLVTVGCPPEALAENAARLDAVMLRAVADDQALMRLLRDPRVGVICLGPGLGTGAREAELVEAALRSRRPLVLDADALTLIARDPGLRRLVHGACVLTPHEGEFARLWPGLMGEGLPKVEAALRAAAEIGATVLYKGPDTVIAEPDGWPQIHAALRERAAPWLATAGAGDVLAGLIAGLLVRSWPQSLAVATAAWLHVEAARVFGPGLIAEDLPETLPKVFRALGA